MAYLIPNLQSGLVWFLKPYQKQGWSYFEIMEQFPILRLALLVLLLASATNAAQVDVAALQQQLAMITRNFEGRVGVCVQEATGTACARGDEKFPQQSVIKLLVGFAVLDAVDHKGWNLGEMVTIRRQDLSLYVQPLAELVGSSGYQTTIGDLVRRAIIDSDSAATDILIARLGGARAIQGSLNGKGIKGVRLDRDERHLQTEIVGLKWHPEFVDAKLLERAIATVPETQRDQAWATYRVDPRDTATPRGMAAFLFALAQGKLLSESSTHFVLQAMKECATFPDRIKAGVPSEWEVRHKTGTSGTWKGITAATNDVGVLRAPDSTLISIAVFVSDSPANARDRASVISKVAAATVAHTR